MMTEVNRKDRKLPVHWKSRIPRADKRNSITHDWNRALRISSCLNDEISKIRQKFLNPDYPLRFINSIIKQLHGKLSENSNAEDNYILPPEFFEIKKDEVFRMKFHAARKTKHLLNKFLRNFKNSLIIYMKSK